MGLFTKQVYTLLALAGTTVTHDTGATLPVRRAVLIVGQSNAQGTGGDTNTAPISAISPSITREFQRSRIVNPTSGQLEKLQFGVNNLGAIIDPGTGKPASFGMELPTAQFFENKYPDDPYAVDIAKYAKGGMQIEHFDKNNPAGSHPGATNDGGGYQATVVVIDALTAAHAAEGATTQWAYGIYRQGETSSANWGTQFKAFDANLIADGKIPSSFIWVVPRVPGAIGLEQDQVAVDLPGRFLLFNTDDAVVNDDLVHWKGTTNYIYGFTRVPNRRYNTNVADPFPMATSTTATPTTLAAGTVTANSAAFSWSAPTGSTNYILTRSTTPDFSADVVQVYNGVATSVTISGLTANTSYYWRLTQQQAGKLISAPQTVTQATPAASGGEGVSIVNDPNQTGAGGYWQASANPELFTQAAGVGLTTSASDNLARSWEQPVNKMKEPFIPGHSYRMRLVLTSVSGVIAQTKFGAIQNSPSLGAAGTYDIDFVATDANDYPAPIFYGSNVVRTIDVFKLP